MKKLILASFILYLPFQLKFPQALSINIINFLLILLMLLFIFSKRSDAAKPRFEIPLLIFLVIWVISFIHTLLFSEGMWQWVITQEFKRLFTLILGYFVFSRCVKTKKDLKFLLYVFLVSIVLVGLHTWRNGMLAGIHFADFKRSSGPFGKGWKGSDIAGGFLAIFTPFLLSYFLLVKKKLLKFIGFVGLVICTMGIFATYSRGSILALGIASVTTILVAGKYFLKTSKFTVVIILIIFIGLALKWKHWVPETIVNRIEGTFQEQTYGDGSPIERSLQKHKVRKGILSRIEGTIQEQTYNYGPTLDPSSQKRIYIWKAGFDLFWSNPLFGVGFKRPQYVLGVDTHNAFILIAAEMGIFGLLAFLWFIWKIIKEASSLLNTEFIFLGIGFIGCMTAFVFVNMFYANFFRDTVTGSFWSVLGMLAASEKFVVNKNPVRPKKALSHKKYQKYK